MTAPRCMFRLHAAIVNRKFSGKPWRLYHRAALWLVRLILDAFDLPTIWRMNRVHRANIAKLDEIARQLDDLRTPTRLRPWPTKRNHEKVSTASH